MFALDSTMLWLALMIVLIVIEILTVGLTTIWFAGGALAATIVSCLGGGWILQIVVFIVISFGMLVFTKPFALKYINSTRLKTNYEGITGKIVRITQTVNNFEGTGCAMVNGQEWTVRSVDDEKIIEAGKLAKVINISGVKLMVEEYKEEEECQV